MKRNLFVVLTIFLLASTGYSQTPLFNGTDLTNWDIFLGTPIPGFEDLAKKATPESTYQVTKLDGQKVIQISGNIFASLASKAEYENYHLHMEFKWGEKVYGKRNSGLLYHSHGQFGAAFGTWMACIEHQLMHDNLGDTYLMCNSYCQTEAKKNKDNKFQFTANEKKEQFGKDFNGPNILKATDAEKPLGEWNTVDLYCLGRTSVHVVNGQVVMINTNCGTSENGQIKPLSKGKIQIQSEGGEFYIRKIELEKINEIPAEFQK